MDETKRQELRLNARAVLHMANDRGWGEMDLTRLLANLALEAVEALNEQQAEVERLREVVGNYRARLTEAEAQIVKLASACEDALSYFEQSWKQVGEHPHAVEAPYVHDLREALGK